MRGLSCCAAAALALAGCSTAAQEGGQRIAITTNPPGAACTIDWLGTRLATIDSTPGYVSVSPAAADLLIMCKKPGYETVTWLQSPHPWRPRTGNVVVNRGTGAIVDAVSGGHYFYPGEIALDLRPHTAGGNATLY